MKCKDCGLLLDSFGICPNANPDDARATRAPVFCGRRLDARLPLIVMEVDELANRLRGFRLQHSRRMQESEFQ
jgi:hypothetical protein